MPCTVHHVELQQGAQGPAVACVQQQVGKHADGVYGAGTTSAVEHVQRTAGISVDGIVGPQTEAALSGSKFVSVPSHRLAHHASNSSSSASSSSGSSIPSKVVSCESGGNYSAVNSSSGAGGAYQILPSTWRAYGGSGSPQSASKSTQDAVAAKIWKSQGSKAWSCK